MTRIYAGSDFIIRERLFVPLDEPGAIIAYETESTRPVDIETRFSPVLDLMWPASMGGQEILWISVASAYLLSEPTHRFAASIGSPDIVAHDETQNNTRHVGHAPRLGFYYSRRRRPREDGAGRYHRERTGGRCKCDCDEALGTRALSGESCLRSLLRSIKPRLAN